MQHTETNLTKSGRLIRHINGKTRIQTIHEKQIQTPERKHYKGMQQQQ